MYKETDSVLNVKSTVFHILLLGLIAVAYVCVESICERHGFPVRTAGEVFVVWVSLFSLPNFLAKHLID